ncbi:MAG: hypothetical protein DME17_18660 [Candidatus Rokuibacteriota bacterium]|nr:MAG: hypothetical protein DME17_18660 [Candidatus Rokubacteria bacterium]HKN48427.1 hypothetical protein [Candidatus Polarisedimenticolia bacterium]
MRPLRLGLAPALVVIATLLSGIPLCHAPDVSAPARSNSRCVFRDSGGQVMALLVSLPAVVGRAVMVARPPRGRPHDRV